MLCKARMNQRYNVFVKKAPTTTPPVKISKIYLLICQRRLYQVQRNIFPLLRLHLISFMSLKLLNEAIDAVRCNETAINPCLKGSRYIWLKNPNNLTLRQQNDLKTLSKENKHLAKAYQMKLTFQDMYRNIFDIQVAEIAFKKWLSWAVRSRLEPKKICQNDKIALFWCVAIFQKQAYSRSNRRNKQPYPRN